MPRQICHCWQDLVAHKLSAMTLVAILLVLAVVSVWLDRHRDRNAGLAGSTDVTDRDRIRVYDDLRYLT
ncbi:hypothetical protein C8D88_103196 [Lentzea atacamensis]|uniref:Uncharacterized protein n=3 Tax=Lentzea TaxID=165301 RepID=A0A316I6H0_9PSEU|nr:hypothetical protein C8D88_103196 [Lentzea atacamensis]